MPTVLAEAYLHTIDPFAVQFTETFGIRWYGLAYVAGFIVGYLGLWWLGRTRRIELTTRQAGDIMFAVVIGVLAGGRLGYLIFYKPELLISFRDTLPYWDALAIQDGGMSSHGGMIGVIIAVLWYCAHQRLTKLHILDVAALLATPGLFFGRIANFINAELPGRPLPDHMQGADAPWWAVQYPREVLDWSPERLEPYLAHLPLTEYPAEAVVRQAHAGNEAVINLLQQDLTAHYPSQLVQALTDGPLLLIPLALIWLKPRMPGVVGAWFFILYGVMRIMTEFIRTPDEGVAIILGLTRGQWLSALMILVGAVALFLVTRRDVPPMGGLRSPAEPSRSHDTATR